VKNLPNQTTEPVCDGIHGLAVLDEQDELAIDDGEDRALGLPRGVLRLD
jgi:hypothetical protein